jgi:hypothetical protein
VAKMAAARSATIPGIEHVSNLVTGFLEIPSWKLNWPKVDSTIRCLPAYAFRRFGVLGERALKQLRLRASWWCRWIRLELGGDLPRLTSSKLAPIT